MHPQNTGITSEKHILEDPKLKMKIVCERGVVGRVGG